MAMIPWLAPALLVVAALAVFGAVLLLAARRLGVWRPRRPVSPLARSVDALAESDPHDGSHGLGSV